MRGLGYTDRELSREETTEVVRTALAGWDLADERVLIIIPDGTRSAPIPEMFRLICAELKGRTRALDFLVALGTHQKMTDEQIDELVGTSPEERRSDFGGVRVFNHEWWEQKMLVSLGTIPAREVEEISGGLLSRDVDVRINRRLIEYDRAIICGPVFPHEVVGFSGGNKYLFPGVSGPEVIDLSHWLGALISNYEIIGKKGTTPVRKLINRAAAMVPAQRLCLALVTTADGNGLSGLYAGKPEEAWSAAAELSSKLHVRYVERPFRRVLSMMPESYDDMWTAAKGMYKLEPAVADDGEVVIYAPHITEFSYTHGEKLAEIGYHVRDYFTKQWDKFKHYPGTVLAHSTHLKGAGIYDEINGEQPRISVTLATGIPQERCREHNLGYLDPDGVDLKEWSGREDEGVLVVPKAGETLYRASPSD
ncbi:MAG: lactate racemase domain-containing protein [Rubrobacteraceae bacterium]